MINIAERYQTAIKDLKTELKVGNVLALPRITKVTVNAGIGRVRTDDKMVDFIRDSLIKITGQKPAIRRARKAIAGFKVRENDIVGLTVTLRGKRMNDFLNRLVNVTLPRVREFSGLDMKHLDNQGNFSIGFKDQSGFVELGSDSYDRPFGLEFTITVARSDKDKSQALFKALGFPVKTG